MLTWKLANGPISGKCNLTLIPINKQMKLFSFVNLIQQTPVFHPPIKFYNNSIAKCPSQKHLGIALDSKSNFNSHVDEKIKKRNKLIGLTRRFSENLPRNTNNLRYINNLLKLILTIAIVCTINEIIKIFRKR